MTKRNFSIISILVLALMFMAVFSPRADARSGYLTTCMSAANATGCHTSAAGVAGKAPTLTSNDCKCCHHHGMASTPVVTTDKTLYTSTENILFKFTGGSQNGRSGLVIYNGTTEVARGVIAEDNSATLSVPASVFGAIANKPIVTKWHGNAINTTGGAGTVCTAQVPCTAHDFSAAINTPAITITIGQTTGTLTGTVTNASGGAAIAGATVTANGATATTNASGVYTMTVNAGTFTATASATGFTNSSASVTVTAGATTTKNFALTAGGGTGPYTLTVASSNPATGVVITATRDLNRKSSGTTPFTLSYNSGTVVTLTAPATAGGNNFQKWQKNGVDSATTASTTVTMSANTTMTAVYAAAPPAAGYKVIAFNDLGMHCACPGQEYFMVLPPFNTIRAQVFNVGALDPVMVSSGVNVSYAMADNNETDSYLINSDAYFPNIIAFGPKMFPGYQPVVNNKVVSISGAGLAGNMKYNSTSMAWEVIGIPAFPVPTGTSADILIDPISKGGKKRDPYLKVNVTVKDTAGKTLATTTTVAPVGFGGCCACHIKLAGQNGRSVNLLGSFQYMGSLHGKNSSKIDFSLIDPDGDGTAGPIRCSWCHWDPAMLESAAPGLPKVWPNYKILPGAGFTSADIRVSTRSFSDVLHQFHVKDSIVLSQFDANIAKNCYDCHPGNGVNCYRGAMKTATVWCTDCHGDLNQRVATGQLTQPWQQSTLPTCYAPSAGITTTFACHDSATYPAKTTWAALFGKFINSRGHKGSVLCSTCHGSPHAEAPSTLALDNAQFTAAQSDTRALGKCDYCHTGMSSTWGVPPHN